MALAQRNLAICHTFGDVYEFSGERQPKVVKVIGLEFGRVAPVRASFHTD